MRKRRKNVEKIKIGSSIILCLELLLFCTILSIHHYLYFQRNGISEWNGSVIDANIFSKSGNIYPKLKTNT
jgi:hypothetical protein